MFDSNILKEKIENHLTGAIANVRNPRGDGEHFLVEVIWQGFESMRLLEQHKKVYEALDSEFKEGLHSISLKTKTN